METNHHRPFLHAEIQRRRFDGGRLLTFFHPLYSTGSKILPIQIPCQKTAINAPKRFGNFINCSNGLILYGRSHTLLVLNPVTGKFVQLPPLPPFEQDDMRTGIMSQENSTQLAPAYYVVLTSINRERTHVRTYSSARGQWSGETVVATTEGIFEMWDDPPVVANGVFHWRMRMILELRRKGLAGYDPIHGEDHLQLIEFPYDDGDESYQTYTMARSGDDLLWAGWSGRDVRKRMRFSMLPKGEGGVGGYRRETTIRGEEWVLMYQFDVESLCLKSESLVAEQRLRLMALLPWRGCEIVGVLRQGRRVFLHHLESGRVWYYGDFNLYCKDLCPYVQSSFLPAYAL